MREPGSKTKKDIRASSIASEVMSEISRQKQKAAEVVRAKSGKTGTGAIQDVVFILSMLSCLILTGLNVTGKMPFQTIVNAPSAAEAETMAYQTLNFAVRAIDAYQRDHGRLPGTLTEVGAPVDPRWNYERDGNDRYRVEFRAPGYPLAYDSASDPDVFFASVRGRHSKGGS